MPGPMPGPMPMQGMHGFGGHMPPAMPGMPMGMMSMGAPQMYAQPSQPPAFVQQPQRSYAPVAAGAVQSYAPPAQPTASYAPQAVYAQPYAQPRVVQQAAPAPAPAAPAPAVEEKNPVVMISGR